MLFSSVFSGFLVTIEQDYDWLILFTAGVFNGNSCKITVLGIFSGLIMHIREAKISDVKTIHSLISYYAELDRMLFRPIAEIYESLQSFQVADVQGRVLGCCALQIIWSELAEIRSLAVAKQSSDKRIGELLVQSALRRAEELGLEKVFALTLEPGFFEKLGFKQIPKEQLPMKVWRDCARCNKQDCCDEVAVIVKPKQL